MAERLALPTSDHGVAGSNPAGGEILPEPKRRFIAQSLSCSPFHRLEMTEILLKGRKTLTHPSMSSTSVMRRLLYRLPCEADSIPPWRIPCFITYGEDKNPSHFTLAAIAVYVFHDEPVINSSILLISGASDSNIVAKQNSRDFCTKLTERLPHG